MPGTAPTGWQNPKTSYSAEDALTPEQFERIEGNAYATELGARTIDPSQSPTGVAGHLRNFLDWFANRIKAITGKTNWYDAPPTTLTATKSHIDAAAPHSGHATTSALSSHTSATSAHSATSEATANRIVLRDAYGRAKVADPSAPEDIARKDTVDQAIANAVANLGFAGWQVFTASGTFTVPAGVSRVFAEVVGGGGRGGNASYDYGDTGAGGGGGGYAAKLITGLTPGASISVTVGAAGGTSSFGSYLSASGGASGGNDGDGGGGAGGVGTNGDLNVRGGAGTAGNSLTSSGGDKDILESGTGGSSVYGGGGAGRHYGDGGGNGRSGGNYGGGGGGALTTSKTNYSGGAGAPGVVIVRW